MKHWQTTGEWDVHHALPRRHNPDYVKKLDYTTILWVDASDSGGFGDSHVHNRQRYAATFTVYNDCKPVPIQYVGECYCCPEPSRISCGINFCINCYKCIMNIRKTTEIDTFGCTKFKKDNKLIGKHVIDMIASSDDNEIEFIHYSANIPYFEFNFPKLLTIELVEYRCGCFICDVVDIKISNVPTCCTNCYNFGKELFTDDNWQKPLLIGEFNLPKDILGIIQIIFNAIILL